MTPSPPRKTAPFGQRGGSAFSCLWSFITFKKYHSDQLLSYLFSASEKHWMESEKNMDRVGKADDKAIPKMSGSELCLTMEMLTPRPGVVNLKPSFPLSCPTEEPISIKKDVCRSTFKDFPFSTSREKHRPRVFRFHLENQGMENWQVPYLFAIW